ncbi:restriction endonuclease subunit S [Exiguobacterium sp. SH5S13]|uniref:restriction endonuclease subunit S n=1 Tax=Exiguobacterium sp. SH5S13 TaxID=2510959 RepID=UPI001375F815|nr:restriction endonuclease subunit S [Exiguobacterium sp. SH5S13]
MADILVPTEIKMSDVFSKQYSLSPINYKQVDVKATNKIKVKRLLDPKIPFIRGTEPGSSAYLKDLESGVKFVRNSCVDKSNNIVQLQKTVFLNETVISYNNEQLLKDGDIVISTDANIGDSALFHTEDEFEYLLSSGMVKLNIKQEVNKYYLLAMLKDSYFNSQLESMTPKGSTIRHSGSRLLECAITLPNEDKSWVIQIVENLMKNILFSEKHAQKLQAHIFSIFDEELNCLLVEGESTRFSDLFSAKRIDAGFYSREVRDFFNKIEKYPSGNKTLTELGYKTKRGPSLQKRDLGRSIKTEIFNPSYSLLIYPSDISDYGIIDKTIFLGAAGKVWFLEKNDILFSAEGNVGKTFAICDNTLRFTTNIHGIIITPIDRNAIDMKNTIFVCTFLNYMKKKGIMDKLSVGGQGGSFAVQYWDILKFPNLKEEAKQKLKKLYFSDHQIDPFLFDEEAVNELGVYEVNKLRTLCSSLLKMIIDDIKSDKLKDKDYYLSQLQQFV